MIHFIETLPHTALSLLVLIFIIAYLVATGLLVRKQPKWLWAPASVLLVLATAFYWYAYGLGGVSNALSKLVLSFSAALDLFLFKMNSTYGYFTQLFYRQETADAAVNLAASNRMVILVGLYLCSMWTTSILIMHFFARRLMSKMILAWKWFSKGGRGIHLFLGANQESLALAKSLGKDARIVFVDLPVREILPNKVLFLQFFQGLRAQSDQAEGIKDRLPNAYVLKASKPLSRCVGKDLFKEMGLGLLKRWANLPDTNIYLLSSAYEENMSALPKLSVFPAQIFCHGVRDGLARRVEVMENGRIHIVDSSFLATKSLKDREELYPIRFMQVAKDEQGQPLGYVEGEFNALICGFGEAGQGMLSFLYEFGAFPQENKQMNHFHCEVLDSRMSLLEGDYKIMHPGLLPDRVSFSEETVGSESFWNNLNGRIENLNYVCISIGKDDDNMKLTLDFLEFAFRSKSTLENFTIVVKLNHPAQYRELIRYYNLNFGGRDTIRTIGDIENTWTWDNISGAGYRKIAQAFYLSYARASASPLSWEERNRQIMEKEVSDLSRKMELQRKTQQDFANYFHTRVKRCLCPENLWKDASISDAIPLKMTEDQHYMGGDPKVNQLLEYLAVGEHIRWVCSHQINGYRLGNPQREDLMIHPDIKPYEQLEEPVKHFDWVVVKTSLEILRGRE